jgi:small GTP-binding protein
MSNDIKIELLDESQISQSDNFINFKIIIIGDSGVGKSSLLKRAVQNKFEEGYQATIGFEFLLMHYQVNELKLKLQIWDTCGEEMYRSLIQGFYRNTSLALIVYDITKKETFDALDIWLKDIRKQLVEDIPIFIVGNKNDLDHQVSSDDAKLYASSNRTKYFTECSAKSGQNVKEIFTEAAKYLYQTYKQFKSQNKLPATSERLKIDTQPVVKKKKCC